MKMKELCEKTDLTRKTIMLYEEKGLITPEKTMQNGRAYREYSEADAEQLRRIATLRKARFTLAEIHTMLDSPERLPEIFLLYRENMQAQYQQMTELMTILSGIDETAIPSVDGLIQRLSAGVARLPLPKSDTHPRFRYLDEIEEDRKKYEQEALRKKRQADDLALSKHLIVSSATRHMSGPRELTLNNQQKLAVFQMLRDNDE